MKLEKENIFKTYKASDRNEGQGNIVIEGSMKPSANLDEQLVECALKNTLDEGARVSIVSDGVSPPDIDINGKVAVEVKGIQGYGNEFHLEKIKKGVKKRVANLQNAWRKNTGNRGERLRQYRECWIAISIPLLTTWIRRQGFDEEIWKRVKERNRRELDRLMKKELRGRSFQEPLVSRVIVIRAMVESGVRMSSEPPRVSRGGSEFLQGCCYITRQPKDELLPPKPSGPRAGAFQ